MSNMIPQTAYLNRVVWEHLEAHTRDLVVNQKKKVYIIAGPIYDEDFGKIGPNNDIPVPSKNFKIVISVNQDQDINDPNVKPDILAVVMPNLLMTGKKPSEDKTELCKESLNLGQQPSAPPAVNLPPAAPSPLNIFGLESLKRIPKRKLIPVFDAPVVAPIATPIISPTVNPIAIVPVPVTVQPPALNNNNDWMQFQTTLDEVEKLSGFRITTTL